MSPVPTVDGEALSMREFARRDGCDPKLVRTAVKYGRLPKRPDGLIPSALVGTGWRQTNRRRGQGGDKVRTVPGDTVRTVPTVIPLPDTAASLTALADGVVRDAAELLLPLLPRETVEAVARDLAARWRPAAIEMLEEDGVPLPAGLRRWQDHPSFSGPALAATDWEELTKLGADA